MILIVTLLATFALFERVPQNTGSIRVVATLAQMTNVTFRKF